MPSKDDIVVAHAWWYTIFGLATSWSSKGLCLTCLTRLSWSSKRSQRFGRASRLFRDCRRAQSLSDPADPVPQSTNSVCLLRIRWKYARGVPGLNHFSEAGAFLVAREASKAGVFGQESPSGRYRRLLKSSPKHHLKPNSIFLQVLKELHGGFQRIGVTEKSPR